MAFDMEPDRDIPGEEMQDKFDEVIANNPAVKCAMAHAGSLGLDENMRLMAAVIALDALHKRAMAIQCPCVIAEDPCRTMCPCIKPYSSHTCLCCARHGSDAQKKDAAKRIVEACREAARISMEKWNQNIEDGFPELNESAERGVLGETK